MIDRGPFQCFFLKTDKIASFSHLTEKQRPLKPNLDAFLLSYLMRANLSKNEK